MAGCWSPGVELDHSIYRYTDQIYKVVQFKGLRLPVLRDHDSFEHHDHKLDPSISRAKRTVLELALCNNWDWFFTCTIDKGKYDRSDLVSWRDDLTQWLRDQRKKFGSLDYLLVPEKHDDGSWHAHGFLRGVPRSVLIPFICMDRPGYVGPEGHRLPGKILKPAFMNWPGYQSKFGYCSLGPIKSNVAAAFYVSKYITKDNSSLVGDVGLHLYYASRGLNRAEKHLDFFGRNRFLDDLCVNDYDFCKTGFTHVRHGLDWTFGLDFASVSVMEPLDPVAPDSEVIDYLEFEQMFLAEMG